MKKVFLSIIAALMIFGAGMTANAEIYDINSEISHPSGSVTKSALPGYENISVFSVTGTVEWTISNAPGIYRISYWVTPDENADKNASIMITSEFIKKSVKVDFTQSDFGWRELCMAECGPAGMSVILNTSSNEYANVCAVKFELISNGYRELCNFCNADDGNMIFAVYSDIAYINGVRINLSMDPAVLEDGLYIALKDVGRISGGNVKYSNGTAEFVFGKKTVCVSDEGIVVDGKQNNTAVLKTLDGADMINIGAVIKDVGKNGVIYDNQLIVYSDGDLESDFKANSKKYRDILTAIRNN